MQHDDGLARHARQVALPLDVLQRGRALVESARGVAPVLVVQQPVAVVERVALDAPLVEEQLVGPKLFSAQGGKGNGGRLAGRRFLARQTTARRRQSGRKHHRNANETANHGITGENGHIM